MNIKYLLYIITVTVIVGCAPNPYLKKNTEVKQQTSIEAVQPVNTSLNTVPADPPKKVSQTFLDTLNSGKEIFLNSSDFAQSTAKVAKATTAMSVQQSQNSYFRIQVQAAKTADRLKEEKKKLEKQFNYPISIVNDAPYYKLYAGEFSQRSEADAALAKIKKAGYLNAWVATIKTASK